MTHNTESIKRRQKYICIEGVEGAFKTTNVTALADNLRNLGYSVLETKEPGTKHLPLTMTLRKLMLSTEYDDEMTPMAREFISQAIRSIHVEKLINDTTADFIIQDRGTLSGKAYAETIGHSSVWIDLLTLKSTESRNATSWNIYDKVILLINDPAKGLALAKEKQEFAGGDAMEELGPVFMRKVLDHMMYTTCGEKNVAYVYTDGKSREDIAKEIFDIVLAIE